MKKRIIIIVTSLITMLLVLFLLRVNWDTVKDESSMLGLHRREVQGIRESGMAIYLSREHDVNYCESLSESLDGDIDSLRKFVQIDYLDGEYYHDHSYRVCKVILSYSPNDVAKCFLISPQKTSKQCGGGFKLDCG